MYIGVKIDTKPDVYKKLKDIPISLPVWKSFCFSIDANIGNGTLFEDGTPLTFEYPVLKDLKTALLKTIWTNENVQGLTNVYILKGDVNSTNYVLNWKINSWQFGRKFQRTINTNSFSVVHVPVERSLIDAVDICKRFGHSQIPMYETFSDFKTSANISGTVKAGHKLWFPITDLKEEGIFTNIYDNKEMKGIQWRSDNPDGGTFQELHF